MTKMLNEKVKSHRCDKCYQKGVWDSKMTFPDLGIPLRTDIQFDIMAQETHHTGHSPLNDLAVGKVTQFSLDYLHLVCLSRTRRLV